MTTIIVLVCVALLLLVILQIGRVRDLAKQLRGAEEVEARNTNMTGLYLVGFMVLFLIATTGSMYLFKNYMLGYGPHESASVHGSSIDSMMGWTLLVTYIVFILTHILLFWYAYKYRAQKGRKAEFISHNNTLEIVWTGIPAIVMTFLVIGGLDAWNDIMADVGTDEDVIEIEATGWQFAWTLRYPGEDGLLGRKDFRLIDGVNSLGQDWDDLKNIDDFHATDLVLPVGQTVRVRITAKDVLHDFYLPQFRVKMDAVPGLPTYFVFTPTKTTKEWRKGLSEYPEYQVPDPDDPDKMLWETRDFELACAELCGTGHWNMRKTVRIVEQDEYEEWLAEQKSFYMDNIRGTAADPHTDKLFGPEIEARRAEFMEEAMTVLETPEEDDNRLTLNHVTFETGSAELTALSRYQLDDAITFLKNNTEITALLEGHTDNTGNADDNITLSEARANAVLQYLVDGGIAADRLSAVGYGDTRPLDNSNTAEAREINRRTELFLTRGSNPASASLSK